LYSVAFSGRVKTLKYRCAACEHCWEVVELQPRTEGGLGWTWWLPPKPAATRNRI